MQQLLEYHSLDTLEHALRQLDLRLARVPELADHRPIVAERRAALETARKAFEDAREARIAASAEIAYLDEEIDGTVMDLSQSLLVRLRRDRNDPAYRKLFPVSPTRMTSDVASPQQDRWVEGIAETLRSDAEYADMRPLSDVLSGLMERLRQSRARREELYVKEERSRTALRLSADDARRFYNGLYHRFMMILPGRKRLVESLFAKFSQTHSSATPADGDAQDAQES